jgi:hypothetical protein
VKAGGARMSVAALSPPRSNARGQLLDTTGAFMREGDVIDISLSELSLRSGLDAALVKDCFGNKAGRLTLLDRAPTTLPVPGRISSQNTGS